jgi:hypothetical protein
MLHLPEFNSLEQLFVSLNTVALHNPEHVTDTRIGKAHELLDVTVRCTSTQDYIFKNSKINRIKYDYAETFWNFMISGGTDAQEAFKDYPGVAQFLTKPKHPDLPANFNTFYGPRIVKQLPDIISELKRSPATRRATLMILNESDVQLLDKGESLEFPCTIALNFTRRAGKLILSTIMRSQNLAIVLQLDIYLQMRLLHLVAAELGIDVKNTEYHLHMINAHLFERDFDYVRSFTA